jgi:nitronate monooxygenase
VIIAQWRDAGVHSGTMRGTIGLVPAVVDAVGAIPVAAAGGIADGRSLGATLSLGARFTHRQRGGRGAAQRCGARDELK